MDEETKNQENTNKDAKKEIKDDEKNSKIEDIRDSENIDLDNLLTLGFNFNRLKNVISNIIKNQNQINYQLSELKLDKINKEKRADELESMILDLKILKEDSDQIKKDLQEQKKKLTSREYQKEIDTILRENGYFLKNIDNLNQIDSKNKNIIKLNDLDTNNKEKIKKEEYENYMNDLLNKEKKELMIYNKGFINEIKTKLESKINDINSNFNDVKSKMICNEKDFILMKQTIKNIDEKLDTKFNKDIPDLVEKLFSSKISEINSEILKTNENFEEKLKKFKEALQKNINDFQKNNLMKNEEIENKLGNKEKDLIQKINTLSNEILNKYLKIKDFKEYQLVIEGKILYENKQINIEIDNLDNRLKNLKKDFVEYISDKTDHDNLTSLLLKYEKLSYISYKMQEMQEEYEKEKKRLQSFDPKKLASLDYLEEIKLNVTRSFNSAQKEFQEIKRELLHIKSSSLESKASLKDLKNLEDNILIKYEDLYNLIKEKFVEKTFISKNNKIIELKMKQLLEEYKKNEKSDTWLLSKKPIGHLCASCEAYIGELKDTNTNTKYIPWNKYPTKDPMDKLYRVGEGFSKMLKLVNPDSNGIKTQSNSINPILTPNRKIDPEVETNSNATRDKFTLNSNMNYDDNSVIQIDNEIINSVKYKLPNLVKANNNLKKNLTFTNFHSNDNKEKLNKTANNQTGLHFNNSMINKMNKNKVLDSKKSNIVDKDEIIHLPNSPQLINNIFSYEEQKGPKIMRIYKKTINENT